MTLLLLVPIAPAFAQYMYMDTNANGIHDEGDRLNANGDSTVVDVWLSTNTNQDGSSAQCNVNSGTAMAINSYAVNLAASGGTVTYRNYINRQAAAFPNQAQSLNPGNGTYKNAFYSFSYSPAGLYRLGTLTITGTGGAPQVDFADLVNGSQDYTSFGTQCAGHDSDNTYKLGIDWHDTAGCAPPGEATPQGVVPPLVEVAAGEPVLIVGEFASSTADSLQVAVQGLVPGLSAVDGLQQNGRKQVRIYGAPDPATNPGSVFSIDWSVSTGARSRSFQTSVRVAPLLRADPQFEQEVIKFYTVEYYHGLPRMKAREFGRRSLPILARLLRDPSARHYWHQIAAGIGLVGDPAYFDTLRSFIWDRFHGRVDFRTYMALMQAQSSLGAMATISARVRAYLETTSTPGAWDALPWTLPQPDTQSSVARKMRRMTIGSISYTDSEWATALLSGLFPGALDPRLPGTLSIAREVNTRIRLRGLAQIWAEQDQGTGGGQ